MMADATLIFMSVWEPINLIFTGLLVVLATYVSHLSATGFYPACMFGKDNYPYNDEDFDETPRKERKDFPKPKPGDRMIFWFVRFYLGRYVSDYWAKPLYSCVVCMGSIHSIAPTLLFLDYRYWPLVCICTVGVNYKMTRNWKG